MNFAQLTATWSTDKTPDGTFWVYDKQHKGPPRQSLLVILVVVLNSSVSSSVLISLRKTFKDTCTLMASKHSYTLPLIRYPYLLHNIEALGDM